MKNNIVVDLKKEYIVKCISINNYAKGVAKIDSLLVFVDNLYPDEEAIIKIKEVHKNYAFGEVIKYLTKSPYRIDDECHHSHDAGSCQFNNITLEYENKLKSLMVKSNIERAIKEEISDIEILYCEPLIGYRNKVTVFFDNDYSFGYFKEGTHEIVKISSCVQIHEEILKVINDSLLLIRDNDIKVYDYKTKSGIVKGISIRRSSYNHLMSVMFLVSKDDYRFIDVSKRLTKENKNVTGVSLSINKDDSTIVYSKNEKVLYGTPYITEKIINNLFEISNQSFLQVNTNGASLLYSEAIKMSDLKKTDTVLDLYCGAGGISLSLSSDVKEVIGLEIVEDAIKSAERNKEINKIDNVTFFAEDAKNFNQVIGSKKIDALFVDPPRSGLSNDAIINIISLLPRKITYISCDSYTLARDLKILKASGYEIKEIKCVNMFLRTKHVETVVLLVRK
ncbi:MAG: 23S rRNA (uracil(1939)-C(5))-methyltransferase RlmD [Clostridia bacterium]|nr:23S rRNA (uracil(1939)-C(5))-methyltransferase RlmD [Clostridia bacterium]